MRDHPDVVYKILDAYGYDRPGGWHDPVSAVEVAEEWETWADQPKTAPGGCTECNAVYEPPLRKKCKCGRPVESILALLGLEK